MNRRRYLTRNAARAYAFDYIGRFYHPRHRHFTLNYVSLLQYLAVPIAHPFTPIPGGEAIRHAANSGVNITYKILFNDAVAMTGGQMHDGGLTVWQIAAQVAAEGAKRVVVNSLAKAQSVVSNSYMSSSSAALGASGTLTIELGSWSDSTFTAGSSSVSVSVAATDTLETIRDKINKSSAGVKATIITEPPFDPEGKRMRG